MRDKILYASISVLMTAGLLTALPAFAQTSQAAPANGGGWGRGGMMRGGLRNGMRPAVFGTVSSISGDTLTVTSKAFGPRASSTAAMTYTVDATKAIVIKNGATSTVSAIASGDTVMVLGTVSGTNVTATRITDGVPPGMGGAMGGFDDKDGPGAGALASLQGNGEPVIGGSVSAINGETLTVTNKSNVTYSVNAAGATVIKNNATSSIASISTGDNVVVQGTVNGNAVTASTVIDQGVAQNSNSGNGSPMRGGLGGVFGVIGGLFHRIFGFF